MAAGMISTYPVPINERERLQALAEYDLLDTPPESDFDRIVGLAARLFNVPIVLVSLVAEDRQFFKAKVGLDVCETSRDVSFCTYALASDDILFVPDATLDERFRDNPLVTGPSHIRFYAGKPLETLSGYRLGTVCLIDDRPHEQFSPEERRNLGDIAALIMDRMELRRLHKAKEVNQARFENIASTSPDAIICFDVTGRITFWNEAAHILFGYPTTDPIGRSAVTLLPSLALWQSIEPPSGEPNSGGPIELLAAKNDGAIFPAEVSISTWREGGVLSVGAIVRDLTERRQNEDRLFRLASLDPLTGLGNRALWHERLEKTLAAGAPMAVVLIDLDGFKEVNDSLGHAAGDVVLKSVADRLRQALSEALTIARLGGDEFVALMPFRSRAELEAVSLQLIRLLSSDYHGVGQVEIGASIGIAIAPEHGATADEIFGAADLALYKAKSRGRGRYEIFTPAIREAAIARRSFERELRLAFENGEFELFYQPQVETKSLRVIGAEALMRWNHPSRGLLAPAHFMAVLSEKPSSPVIGEWAIRSACVQVAKWRQRLPQMKVGVNLFASQLRSRQLPRTVENILLELDLPSEALELEIVETIILGNDQILRSLQEIREMGVGLAFDDYGTGYASLSLLKQYPVTRLKIDRSFVMGVTTDEADAAVVKAIIYLGNSFGLRVVAEGVETPAQLDFLRASNCWEAQGYLFGKPAPAEEFLRKHIESQRYPRRPRDSVAGTPDAMLAILETVERP